MKPFYRLYVKLSNKHQGDTKVKDYTYSEIGMLIGIAVGGAIASVGLQQTRNPVFLVFAVICTLAGTMTGKLIDKRDY